MIQNIFIISEDSYSIYISTISKNLLQTFFIM